MKYLISSFNSQSRRLSFADENKSNLEDLKRVKTCSIPLFVKITTAESQRLSKSVKKSFIIFHF